jgi:hypothetical protein
VVAARLPNGVDFLSLHAATALVGTVFLPIHVEADAGDVEADVGRGLGDVARRCCAGCGDRATAVAVRAGRIVRRHPTKPELCRGTPGE